MSNMIKKVVYIGFVKVAYNGQNYGAGVMRELSQQHCTELEAGKNVANNTA